MKEVRNGTKKTHRGANYRSIKISRGWDDDAGNLSVLCYQDYLPHYWLNGERKEL